MRKLWVVPLLALTLILPSCEGLPELPFPIPIPVPVPTEPYDCDNRPEVAGRYFKGTDAIEGRILVVLQKKAPGAVRTAGEMRGIVARVLDVLKHAKRAGVLKDVKYFDQLGQFAATVDDVAVIGALLADPDVLYVSQEQTFTVSPKRAPQAAAVWGIDRVDQRDLPLDGEYEPGATGAGIHVDIIDTGVGTAINGVDGNPEFEGRVIAPCHTEHTFQGCADGHGHGTHVAGTVGGRTWGVAKGVFLHSIRVLGENGSGTTSQVMAGINKSAEWATAAGKPRVANMSLGGPADPPLDQAVCDALAAGVVFAIAAGNDYGADPNGSSPARVVQALTLGATDRNDRASDFSNSGTAIGIWAPGEDIESERPDGGSATFSGTSMASPHAAGALALYLERHPEATVGEAIAGVVAAGTPDKLSGVGASPNVLLYVRED